MTTKLDDNAIETKLTALNELVVDGDSWIREGDAITKTFSFKSFIRAFGWLAIFLLHVVLVIGPLSRINRNFLIVLYNRRHLGVTMFLVGLVHGIFSILQFHSLGNSCKSNCYQRLFLERPSSRVRYCRLPPSLSKQ